MFIPLIWHIKLSLNHDILFLQKNLAPIMIVFVMFAITMFLYFFAQIISKKQISNNIYFSGILAGATGAFWGFGIQKGYEFFRYHLTTTFATLV